MKLFETEDCVDSFIPSLSELAFFLELEDSNKHSTEGAGRKAASLPAHELGNLALIEQGDLNRKEKTPSMRAIDSKELSWEVWWANNLGYEEVHSGKGFQDCVRHPVGNTPHNIICVQSAIDRPAQRYGSIDGNLNSEKCIVHQPSIQVEPEDITA